MYSNAEMMAPAKRESLEAARLANNLGPEVSDDVIIAKEKERLKSINAGNDRSYTNAVSRFLLGDVGGSLSSLFGAGHDANGFIDAEGKYVVSTCFVAGTKIHKLKDSILAKGVNIDFLEVNADQEELVNIEDIKQGNYVKSWNEKTGKTSYKKVLNAFARKTTHIFNLTIDEEKISTTWNHPFYVMDKGWVQAKDLQLGETLISAIGTMLSLDDITIEKRDEVVYNFEVEDDHTYYVGAVGVLVHNDEKCGIYGLDQGTEAIAAINALATKKDIKSHKWRLINNTLNFVSDQLPAYVKNKIGINGENKIENFDQAYSLLNESNMDFRVASDWIRKNGTPAQVSQLAIYEHNTGIKQLFDKEYTAHMQILYKDSLSQFTKQKGDKTFKLTAYERETMREAIGADIDKLNFSFVTSIPMDGTAQAMQDDFGMLITSNINNSNRHKATSPDDFYRARAEIIMHEYFHLRQYSAISNKFKDKLRPGEDNQTGAILQKGLRFYRERDLTFTGDLESSYQLGHITDQEIRCKITEITAKQLLSSLLLPDDYKGPAYIPLEALASLYGRRYGLEYFERYRGRNN